MTDNAASTGTRSQLRRVGLPAVVVAACTALGVLLLPYANTLVALLLPNALAIALLLTVAVINERRRVEARTQRAEGELRAAEGRARAAEACLLDAIDSLNEGFVLFDPDDRLVLCNRKYRDLYAISADLLQTGARFEEIIREGAKRGQYVEAMATSRRPGSPTPSRWPLCSSAPGANGGSLRPRRPSATSPSISSMRSISRRAPA